MLFYNTYALFRHILMQDVPFSCPSHTKVLHIISSLCHYLNYIV